MKRHIAIAFLPLLVLGLGVAFAPAAHSQTTQTTQNAQEEDGGNFAGRIVLGYRSVDVGGTETKYREDVNQSDGPRLMDLDFELTPEGTARAFADRITLDVDNLGDDPFQSLRLGIDKFGTYRFSYNRWESDYFYQDVILPPEQADIRASSGGDFHHFDFQRVRDQAKLDMTLSPRAELNFGFNRYTKVGDSTTTLDLQRDEYELDKPIDEEMSEYQAGFQYAWDKVTLVLDERYTEFDNAYELFLPGFSLGENPTGSSLDFYFLDQPYSYESWNHTLRVVAKPTDDWVIRASGTLQTLSLDLDASERSQGIGANGLPFTDSASGSGDIDRDADLFDLDLTYVINDRFAVIGGYFYRNLDQSGLFTYRDEPNRGRWDVETNGFEAGLEVTLSPELTFTGGLRVETRDVSFGHSEDADFVTEDESTDHDGYFASLGWRPSNLFYVSVDYEDDSFDDPFTLASPTDRSRVRARGQVNLKNGFWGSASFALTDYENGNSGWDASTQQILGRVGYRKDRFEGSLGYSAVEIDRFVDFAVPAIPTLPARDYTAESDFLDALARFRVTDAFLLGAEARLYENDGSFGVERDDYRLFGEYQLASGLLYRASYRTIDYNEKDFNFDDYDADIIDFGVGLTW
jgi:hypothetical protein